MLASEAAAREQIDAQLGAAGWNVQDLAELKSLPGDHTLVTKPLRDCQVSAITGLEKSLADNRPRALLQMATGSGKTYTAVTQAYRLIKHAGARRILLAPASPPGFAQHSALPVSASLRLLVDRGNLGRQTVNEPSGARQTARQGSPEEQRGGADQFQQFTTTTYKLAKMNESAKLDQTITENLAKLGFSKK